MNSRMFAAAIAMTFAIPAFAAPKLYVQSGFNLGFSRIDDLKAVVMLLADDDQEALRALITGCVRKATCINLKQGQPVFEAMRDAPSTYICARLERPKAGDAAQAEGCYWITASAAVPEDMYLDYRPALGPAIVKFDNLPVFHTPEAAASARTARVEGGSPAPEARKRACMEAVDCEIIYGRSQQVVIEMLSSAQPGYACIVGGMQTKCMWTHAAGLSQGE